MHFKIKLASQTPIIPEVKRLEAERLYVPKTSWGTCRCNFKPIKKRNMARTKLFRSKWHHPFNSFLLVHTSLVTTSHWNYFFLMTAVSQKYERLVQYLYACLRFIIMYILAHISRTSVYRRNMYSGDRKRGWQRIILGFWGIIYCCCYIFNDCERKLALKGVTFSLPSCLPGTTPHTFHPAFSTASCDSTLMKGRISLFLHGLHILSLCM